MQAAASAHQDTASWHSGMLPQPSIDFTIPSIHDGTILECQLYHPKRPRQSASHPEVKAVIIAHPYAPLGGSFDDHVVHAAGREFLSQGYILGLFNLRGAGGSKGHTSWSSKPEQDDYISFVGFLACYMKELQHLYAGELKPQVEHQNLSTEDATSLVSQSPDELSHGRRNATDEDMILVLGGYSYGSHIVRHLPDIASILNPFMNLVSGTAAAEIQLQATQFAQKHVREQELVIPRSTTHMIRSSFDHMHEGGINEDKFQHSCQKPRKSFERLRKSVEKSHIQLFKHRDTSNHHGPKEDTSPDARRLVYPEIRYLLISPLLPPVSAFLALSTHWWKVDPAAQERLRNHQCLAIWGDHDVFTSNKKLKKWARELAEFHTSMFQYTELQGVGHFWLEHDAESKLRHSLRSWIQKCDGSSLLH